MVPKGWNKYTGSDITFKITKGSSPKWQGFDYQKNGTLFVTSENVRDGFLDVSKPKYLPLEFNIKLKNSQLKKGDILINIVGASIGRSCKYNLDSTQANINQAVCLFRTNERVESDYIYQYLQSENTINRLLGKQTESARPNLSLTDMRDFIFAIPPLPEQQKIAKILTTWDNAIRTTERLIENSRQQKKALMEQLLNGKKRLLDDEGKRFEGDWEDTKLENIIHLLSGHAFKSSEFEKHTGFKLLRGINISRGFLRWGSEQTFTWSNAEKYERYLLKINDIVVSMDGSLVGRNYALIQQKNFEPMLLVQRVARIRCKSKLSPTYLLQHISSKRFEYYVDSVKTVTAIPHISVKDIREFTVPLASIEEQQKIAAVLTNADKEIELLEQQLADLQQEKKALMQQLLTGKRRVVI